MEEQQNIQLSEEEIQVMVEARIQQEEAWEEICRESGQWCVL